MADLRREDLILLNMAGVGKRTLDKLSGPALKKRLAEAAAEHDVVAELACAGKEGVGIITIDAPEYPAALKEIHSPPLVLYHRGAFPGSPHSIRPKGEAGPSVAIVGSRRASSYGMMTAEKLGYDLASRGVVIVSGLAKGIDSAAHRGALEAHGRTVAVLGNGLATVYPPENKELAARIVDQGGALITELSMEAPPLPVHFPRRNRIISGLSLAVIVVEASRKSGALITADFALEQDREVFAVPGKIDSPTSFGSNGLIKQGATLVQTADDVIEELGLALTDGPMASPARAVPDLDPEERALYQAISDEPQYLDDILERARMPLRKAAEVVLRLELKKAIRELPGKKFIRTR